MSVQTRNSRGAGFFTQRGVILGAIVALHVGGLAVLSMGGVRAPVLADETPVEVTFLNEVHAPLPPELTPTRLVNLRPTDPTLPVVDIPLVETTPAPNAITVAAPVEKKVEVASVRDDSPALIDSVEYLEPPRPRYPPMAKRSRSQGTVYLRVLIGPEGQAKDIRVHRSSGFEQLDTAACDAVRRSRFKPHRENGVPRSAQVIIPIEFSLSIRTASVN